jgi:hypothetical protein
MDIDKLKLLLSFCVKFTNGLVKRLEDGKLTLLEGITMAPIMASVPELFNARKEILEELKGLDPEEVDELIKQVGEELELESKKANAIVQASIKWLEATCDLIESI